MRFENDKGFIRIDFTQPWYEDPTYIELSFDFSIEGYGWSVVGDCFFSLSAIKAMAENFDSLIEGKIDEFHISEDDPQLIPKPFYWLDFIRQGDQFEAHIKIHDCLDDYIEVTEIIGTDKLAGFQAECQQAYENNSTGQGVNKSDLR